jgi:hypothetical protein
MEAFFRTVNFILADQIRSMILATIEDYVNLFQNQTAVNASGLSFSVKLNIAESALAFEPSLSDFQSQLESIYEMMLNATEKVQKAEFQLFQKRSSAVDEAKIPNLYIQVNFSQTHTAVIQQNRDRLKVKVAGILTAPKGYLKEYDRFKAIITGSAENDLKDLLNTDVSIERQFEVYLYLMNSTSSSCICFYIYRRSKSIVGRVITSCFPIKKAFRFHTLLSIKRN